MAYLEQELHDELLNEMRRMGMPLTETNIELASATMQNLMARNPQAVMILVDACEPEELSEEILRELPPDYTYLDGLGALGRSKRSKRHKKKINAIMNSRNAQIDAVRANPNLTAEQKEEEEARLRDLMNTELGMQKKHNKKVKKAAKKRMTKYVAAAAAIAAVVVIPGATSAIGKLATKAVGPKGIIGKAVTHVSNDLISNLTDKAKATGESPLGMIDNFIPGASEQIQKFTGQSPQQLNDLANQMFDRAAGQANSAMESGTVLPDTPSPETPTAEPKAEEPFFSKKNLPTIAAVGGGSLLLLTGLIILTRR